MTSNPNGDNAPLDTSTTSNAEDQYARTMANEQLGSGTRYTGSTHATPPGPMPGSGSGYSTQQGTHNFQQQTQNVYQQQEHQMPDGSMMPGASHQGGLPSLDGTGSGTMMGVIGVVGLLGVAYYFYNR